MVPPLVVLRALAAMLSLACFVVPSAMAAPAPEPEPVVSCTLELRNLPATLRQDGGYRLRFSDRPTQPVPASGAVELELGAEAPVLVSLEGPAYYGAVALDAASCAADPAPVLYARPHPARLRFQTSISLEQLSVGCVEGCEYGWRVATDFPAIVLGEDQTERFVRLEFKARGRRSRVLALRVTPGDNLVRVSLDHL